MKKLKLTRVIVSSLVVATVFALNPIRVSAKWIKAEDDKGVLWRYSD